MAKGVGGIDQNTEGNQRTNYQLFLTIAIYSSAFVIFIYTQKFKQMKKTLLSISGLLIAILLAVPNQVISQKADGTGNSAKSLDLTLIEMGSSSHVFTMLNSQQNQVDYNPDLNMVTFVHRQNTALTPQGGSGTIRFDYSTDGGATWPNINEGPISPDLAAGDGTIMISTTVGEEEVYGLRNPNGAIYNPSGNTDMANAFYISASASAISDGGFGHIGANCFTTTKMSDLNTPSEQYLQALSTDTVSDDYFPFGLVQGGDAMYTVSSMFFTDGIFENYEQLAIWKGVLNNDQNDFEWSSTVIDPGFVTYTVNDGGGDYESLMTSDNRSMAFSPDGSVGYMVVLGSLDSYEENLSRPIVYKTTDAGANWELQPELDIVNMPVAELVEYTEGSNTIKRPVVWSMDVVVDVHGTLHVLSEMNRGTLTDGEAFTWVDVETEISNTFYIDFSLNTNGEWASRYIGQPVNIGVGIPDAGWVSFYVISHELQTSRTPDGSKVFFGWLASPLASDDTNVEPDVFVRGLDVVNNMLTEAKNMTFDSDIESIVDIASLAPTCIVGGDDFDYEMPYVIIEDFVLGFGVETIFSYLKGIGFNNDEFTVVSVEELELAEVGFKVWPNPANNYSNIAFSLDKTTHVEIMVYNSIGQKELNVFSGTLQAGDQTLSVELNDLKPGLYLVNLIIDNNRFTQHLVIN